jgi:hypothetical protein
VAPQNGSVMDIGCPTLGRRLASLAGAVAALAVTVTLALSVGSADGAPTGGASPSSPCREVTCTVSFAVGSKVKRWTSPQLFFPANEQIMAKFVTGKAQATLLKSYGAELCKHRFYGAATTILVKACGLQTQVRVRAVRLKRGLRRLSITYAANPYMSGEAEGRDKALYDGLTALTGLSWD